MATRKVPALTDGGKINEKHIPERLSEGALSATIESANEVQVPPLVAAAIAADGTVAAAAAVAVQDAAVGGGLVPGEATAVDEFSVRFDDGEPFVRMRELEDSQGWDFVIQGINDQAVFGLRSDGTWYPDNFGGSESAVVSPVVRFGDSLTANWGSGYGLSALLGREVANQGIGGQNSMQIAARQGGAPSRATVTGGLIPASGSVGVTLTVRLRSDTTGSHPVVIGGVAGAFTATNATDFLTGTFVRTTPGLPVKVQPGTPVQSGFAYRRHFPIFWFGRNNFKSNGDAEQIVADLREALDWSAEKEHALILSIPPWPGEYAGGQYSAIRVFLDEANAAIRDAFPAQFLDTATALQNVAVMAAVGVTATSQDLTDITNGETPTSFRSAPTDGHINAKAYEALDLLVAQTYASKGWNL